ncbi:hypothetical protein MTR67_043712 [Solanum verrucosum]|uniref:Uncharacterized protein n=1 Tax=Solanum verrucosum TaxID=315347 RepID=A0AAF0ZSA4_SOLVR|nr:hypothetical protein MTR67_043712 [Solanum verrucosum]
MLVRLLMNLVCQMIWQRSMSLFLRSVLEIRNP